MQNTDKYTFIQTDEVLFASTRFVMKSFGDLEAGSKKIKEACEGNICGDMICVYRFGTVKEGRDVEVGFPVSKIVDAVDITTRFLEPASVISTEFSGTIKDIGTTYSQIYKFASDGGFIVGEEFREVWQNFSKEDARLQVQVPLHPWKSLFVSTASATLPPNQADELARDGAEITPFSNLEDRFNWARRAVEKLDKITEHKEKYEIISKCAHFYPPDLIARAREAYRKRHEVDDVLEFIKTEGGWYPNCWREGDKIYCEKKPQNPEAHRNAKTDHERRKAFCHCPVAKFDMDNMPDSFCLCGAGWMRQFWEGILGVPIQINVCESVLSGGQTCRFSFELETGHV
ncbi:MAG TPA: hypothetical protein PKV16_08440 [Caldisericia bacterium]|nr:hypothetical protein [Caldisericia bacterium]HPF49370.1 hypothetical protein [Caldisericia bacterium]HPI84446.1 hypothetical protein [Caldisericia bacterium]HPQ93793.1 hypothetical protein [Caldisericia bacterium]HRV75643.1 hypothetical protein [Caldisericia bacterium]